MKKEILDALKAKFIGVSDAILGRIADKLEKTVTRSEDVKDAVDRLSFQQVLESYGDSRATEAQQTAVLNYEKKYGLKDGKKSDDGGAEPSKAHEGEGASDNKSDKKKDDAGEAETIPSWAKTLLDGYKSLTARLDKMDGEKIAASRKQKLSAVVEKLPESLRHAYERTSVDGLSDAEFDGLLTEVTKEVDGIIQESRSKGTIFGKPGVSTGGGNDADLTQAQKDAITKREGAVGTEAQPF